MTGSRLLAGNVAAVLGSCLFGASIVATRSVVKDVPPLSLATLRFGQGAFIIFAVLTIFSRPLLRVDRRDMRSIAVAGALLFGIFPVLFNKALDLTTASRGSVMLATMPLWTALLARASSHESLSRRQVTGVLISVLGVAVVVVEGGGGIGGDTRAMVGNVLMIVGAFCGGLYGVLAKPLLNRYPAITVTAYAMLVGTVILLPLALIEGLPDAVIDLDRHSLTLVLYLGVLSGALAYYLISFALARLTPTLAVAYINLNPMIATVLGALLLDEVVTRGFVLGFALVGSGLILANWPGSQVVQERPAALAGEP